MWLFRQKKTLAESGFFRGFTDCHSHLLPGIDDGSPDLDSSLGLAEAAVADGITHALMTPHTLNGKYLNHKKDIITGYKVSRESD